MTNPIRAALDKAAEELWREGFRITQGVEKPESWAEKSEELKQKWRQMAAVGNAAFLRALTDSDVLALLSAEKDPHHGWRDTLADAVLAAAKEERE
jgi:hypothetical protein